MLSPALKIRIIADGQQAKKTLDAVKHSVNGLGGSAQGMKPLARGIQTIGVGLRGMLPIIAGVVVGIKAVKRAVADTVTSFKAQEQAEARLAAVVRATGEAAGYSARELESHASALQNTTTFGDELIISAQAMLATFKSIQGPVFQETSRLALDLSAAFGQDLKSSVMQLGKALEDPAEGLSALRRIGVSFTAAQQDMIKSLEEAGKTAEAQRVILETLEQQVGGTAAAMANTATGAIDQYLNSLGDLKEEIGALIAESLQPMIRWATEGLNTLTTNLKIARQYKETLTNALAGDYGKAASELENSLAVVTTELRKQKKIVSSYKTLLGNSLQDNTVKLSTVKNLESEIKKAENYISALEHTQLAIGKTMAVQQRASSSNAAEPTSITPIISSTEKDKVKELFDGYKTRLEEIRRLQDEGLIATIRGYEERAEAAEELYTKLINLESQESGEQVSAAQWKEAMTAYHQYQDELSNVGGVKVYQAELAAARNVERERINTTKALKIAQAELAAAQQQGSTEQIAQYQGVIHKLKEMLVLQKESVVLTQKNTQYTQSMGGAFGGVGDGIINISNSWSSWKKNLDLDSQVSAVTGLVSSLSAQTTDFIREGFGIAADEARRRISELRSELTELEEGYELQLETLRNANIDTADFELSHQDRVLAKKEKVQKVEKKLAREQFEITKALQLGQAIGAGALAIVQAATSGWLLPAAVLVPMVTALTATQIGIIAAQKPPPGLYQGGIVPAQGEHGGIYRLGDKNTPEAVIPLNEFFKPQRTQSPVYIYFGGITVNGNIIGDEGIRELSEKAAEEINHAIENKFNRGVL